MSGLFNSRERKIYTIYHIPGRKFGCTQDLEIRKKEYLAAEGKIPDGIIQYDEVYCTAQEAGDYEWKLADEFGYPRGPHYVETIRAMNALNSYATMTYEKRVEAGTLGGTKTCSLKKSGYQNLSHEQRVENGIRLKELKLGYHALTLEQRVEYGKIGGQKTVELGIGIHAQTHEQYVEAGKKGGHEVTRLKRGIHALTYEQRSEIGKKAGRASALATSPERKSEISSKGGKAAAALGRAGFQQEAICQHCGKKGKLVPMSRWHFDNCRHKRN